MVFDITVFSFLSTNYGLNMIQSHVSIHGSLGEGDTVYFFNVHFQPCNPLSTILVVLC